MASDILSQLADLQPSSGKTLKTSIIHGFHGHLSYSGLNPIQLITSTQVANMNWKYKPRYGAASLAEPKNRQAVRKVMTLAAGQENNFTYSLNTALLGGESYPILTALLGTAAGIASFGAGLLFTAATTGLSLAQTSQRVLARSGDEIWQVEEIGKVRDGGSLNAVHVNAYFLVDPYRGQSYAKGWLIHEEREELSLEG
ncbi:MAG: hypothetical protein PVJ72_17715 [Gammaproteobacteria bacterium]